MKIHTTNYTNTFIGVAEDCKKVNSEIPPLKLDKPKSIARMQYELIIDNPYKYTSDEILFAIHAERKEISESSLEQERKTFFLKDNHALGLPHLQNLMDGAFIMKRIQKLN